jgi:membrane fusion protein (multidrug efflux system)
MRPSSPCLSVNAARAAFCVVVLALLSGCGRQPAAVPAAPLDVSTITVKAQDVPVSSEYVAQTQSSQAVNIQARVSGFLDKRIYTEGAAVKTGQLLYQIDPKPFQAQVDAAAADLQRNQASYETAAANLQRVKPLVEQNALSQKDLDDARGQADQAAAAVAQARAQLESAKLDLSYTRITSPVDGVTSYSSVAEGTYVSSQNSQLTTVSVLDPMWVNFSISENEVERIRGNVRKGLLKPPPDDAWQVEIVLSDGKRFPNVGRITFADPSYNAQTGTFMIRATVSNPEGLLRPNQYVRATINGAVRPSAIVVPQRAVQQGAQGHFVWLINKDGKAELRPVVVGDWYRDGWFINEGLQSGDRLVVDGAQRLAAGAGVKVVEPPAADASAPASAANAATANRGS